MNATNTKKMKIGIPKGKIRCKFCNHIYQNALSAINCGCGKKTKWPNPNASRKTIDLRLKFHKTKETIRHEEKIIHDKIERATKNCQLII